MKKLAIAVVTGLVAVCLLGTTVLASDPIIVDVVVLGDDPTVTVEADGEGATIYINGQDIQQPTVYKYRIENSYDDATLKEAISGLDVLLAEAGMNLAVTSDGLAKVILVIGEHTSNLRELLGTVGQNEVDSVSRDNELITIGKAQDLVILQQENSLDDYKLWVSETFTNMEVDHQVALANMEADYQAAISDLSSNMDTRVDELSSDFNTKLVWTWASVGVFGLLLLGVWRLWQVRLRQD